ncbi:MAG: hypothetical protein HRT35_18050 [Algicola sp.]|nr:hypothetical protein [Algicola sp.]
MINTTARMSPIVALGLVVSLLISPAVQAKKCYEENTKIIGRITIDQKPFQSHPALRKVPFIVWDALRSGFSRLIYDTSLCMTQESVVFSNPSISNNLPLKPVKNPNLKTPLLVTDFYDKYDREAEAFLADLLHQQGNNMSIVVYWDTPSDEALKNALGEKKVALSYTIFDAQNYTEVPFEVEIDLPIISRKKTIEKLATQFYEQIKKIRENISAVQSE